MVTYNDLIEFNDGYDYFYEGRLEDMEYHKEESYQEKVNRFIDSQSIWNKVIQEMHERKWEGYRKYQKHLTTDTDEDMLQHLYEELLDATVYIRTLIEQRGKNKL